MYSFTEIALIFSNCTSKEECGHAREAFAAIAEDLSGRKIFYVRNQQRTRERELEQFKTK